MISGETAQVQSVLEVVPDAWGPEGTHLHPQWHVALPLLRLWQGLQQADQSTQPPLPAHG